MKALPPTLQGSPFSMALVISPLVFTERQLQDVPISHSPGVATLNWDLLPA